MRSRHAHRPQSTASGLERRESVELDAFRALLTAPRETVGELCRMLDIDQSTFIEYWQGDRPIPDEVLGRTRDILHRRAEEMRQLSIRVSKKLHRRTLVEIDDDT